MARVLLVGVDLFLRAKLEALLPEHRFSTVDGIDPPDLVIADIVAGRPGRRRRELSPTSRCSASRTTPTRRARRAHAAGFDQVIAKSALFERSQEVIGGLLASVE